MDLYAVWSIRLLALSIYSCLSITTIVTPLSAVKITVDLSLFNSLMACCSALLMLGLVEGTS